jgi:hypothetical protein
MWLLSIWQEETNRGDRDAIRYQVEIRDENVEDLGNDVERCDLARGDMCGLVRNRIATVKTLGSSTRILDPGIGIRSCGHVRNFPEGSRPLHCVSKRTTLE